MDYSFNTDVAKIVGGADAATIIQNLMFWIKKNIANKKHCYEGKYWTYNSLDAFVELFPWLNRDQIFRILNKLTKNGYIEKGEFNKFAYDRTKWYTIIDESILRIYNVDITISQQDHCENTTPIPDCNTDNNTDSNTNSFSENLKSEDSRQNNVIKNKSELRSAILKIMSNINKTNFTDIKSECMILSKVINRGYKLVENNFESTIILFRELLKTFLHLRKSKDFWKTQPFTPRTLWSKRIWEMLLEEMKANNNNLKKSDEMQEVMEEVLREKGETTSRQSNTDECW